MFDEDDDYPPVTVEDLQIEIDEHEASYLLTINRNPVNGMVTFRFCEESGNPVGELVFDELEEDMGERAKAVLTYVSTIDHFILYQNDVERVWSADVPKSRFG